MADIERLRIHNYQRNMAALQIHKPDVYSQLLSHRGASDWVIREAKNGCLVPCMNKGDRLQPLHSLFDPCRESKRYVETLKLNGYIVMFGLGAGYHVSAVLDADISGCLIVEVKACDVIRFLECSDISGALSDPRLNIVIDPSPGSLCRLLPTWYLPALSGNLETAQLKPRVEAEPGLFAAVSNEVKEAVSGISDDYATQATFGFRWFSNMIANLERADVDVPPSPESPSILVAAAGPSIELHEEELRDRGDSVLIAVDSCVPYLNEREIPPDLIITIDCQPATYHHFLGDIFDVPVIADLASPPAILRNRSRVGFFFTGHPFSQFLRFHSPTLPSVDVSGGNVTYSAVSLASQLGAQEITVYGADFGYPDGKIYARGTYLLKHFLYRSVRDDPYLTKVVRYIFGNPSSTHASFAGREIYGSTRMDGYRTRTTSLFSEIPARVTTKDYRGTTVYEPGTQSIPNAAGGGIHRSTEKLNLRNAVQIFYSALNAADLTHLRSSRNLSQLRAEDRMTVACLLPLAASDQRYRDSKGEFQHIDSLFRAREFALARMQRSSLLG